MTLGTHSPTFWLIVARSGVPAAIIRTAPKSATRVYAESAAGTTLDQKIVSADGKEMSIHMSIKYDGKDYPVTGNPDGDTSRAR